MSRHYITTAIDYPNAAPHMGHVLEKVLADVLARWFRLRGDDVRFQIGTDEHGIKIQQTADRLKMTPRELVEKNVPLFQQLYKEFNISSDVFIRTTDQTVHWPTVRELWKRLDAAGALEKRTYKGLYCSGCERFVTAKDLADGKCPDHGIAPQEVSEENYFFKLKNKEEALKKLLDAKKGTYTIIPDYRAEETLVLLHGGLEDVSFSRPKTSLSWGIPVPGDELHTMYVWCDALTNYISGIDIFALRSSTTLGMTQGDVWWNDAIVTHVIGKDIARFHALIWPAMLQYAGLKTPDQLLMHGFVTSDGQKMSKSLGNVISPVDVLAKYSVDALRFFLIQAIPVGQDGDFSWNRLREVYDGILRNAIGNLFNRVLTMIVKEGGTLPAVLDEDSFDIHWSDYERFMNTFELHFAIAQIHGIAIRANKFIDTTKPWTLPIDQKMLKLASLAECLRHIALMLLPIIPTTAGKMARQLGLPNADKMLEKSFEITDDMKQWGGVKEWKRVGEPEILFAPLE